MMWKTLTLISVSILLFSCKTYTITPESFKEQFATIEYDESYSKSVLSGPIYYNGYVIKNIKVITKEGNLKVLDNDPALEMRVTLKNGKRKIIYFDSMKLEHDTLKGSKARFFSKLITKVPFSEVTKIEIQESGKKIKYVNN